MKINYSKKPDGQKWFLQGSLILLASVLLSGCFQSDAPVKSPDPDVTDDRLVGLWHSNIEGNDVYLHVIKMEKPWLRLIKVVHINHGGISENTELDMFPSKVGSDKYINVKFRKTPSSAKEEKEVGKSAQDAYWFYKYAIAENGVMAVWSVDYPAIKEAVDKGKLKGKAWETTWMDNITLLDSSEHISAFLAEPSGEQFKVMGQFKRMQEVP